MQNRKHPKEVSGGEALTRRDALEVAAFRHIPKCLHRLTSEALTRITGLAPSASDGKPIWPGSETRSVLYEIGILVLGMMFLMLGGPFAVIGGLFIISGMRNFTSSIGHHLTHSATRLPWPVAWTKTTYDIVSALFWLPSYLTYRIEHRRHHANVAGPSDPDQEFIEWVSASLEGRIPFVKTLLSPAFHVRFLAACARATMASGPVWRRILAAATIFVLFFQGWSATAAWVLVTVIGFQTASFISWMSLHLWNHRPTEGNPFEIATAVTFGRLLIPEPTTLGLAKLLVYAFARALWLQGDLPNHDLHHIGRGPWTEAPYVRTHMLLEGIPLRQTVTLGAMFEVAMEASNHPRSVPRAAKADGDFLQM